MDVIQYVVYMLILIASFSNALQNPMKYIEYITKTYFSGESLLFVYWSNVSMDFRQELMDYWVTSELVTVETCNCDHVADDIIWERSYVKNIVVLFGNMIPELRYVNIMKHCVSWNGRSKILAIVDDSDDIVSVTLNNIWKVTKAINVTIMVSDKSSVRYYTSYPYNNFKIVELDQNVLFPPKSLNNLHGTVIRTASAPCSPYILKTNVPNVYSDGLEVRIINYLSQKFNFKLDFIGPPPGENAWITLSKDNRKVVGNFGLLDRCEADIAVFGVQIRPDRYLIADYTAIHSIDNMVWVVPIRPYSFSWRSIIIVFKKELWGLLFSTLILIAVMLYLIVKYEFGSPETSYNFFDAFFQTLGIYLYVPIHFYRKRQLYRLFIFTVSYFTIIIVALYQSSLITYLTTRGSKDQYNTIYEAVDDGLIGYFYPSGKPSYNLSEHDLWNKILSPGRHVYEPLSAVMLPIIAYNKTAYALIMDSLVNFEIHKNLMDENHQPMVRMLPKIFLPYLATIFTSKGHPLRGLIKDSVLRLYETGMLMYWTRDILRKNSNTQEGKRVMEVSGPVALSVDQLRGAFYILPFLFTISGIVFVCEVVCNWWMSRKKKRFEGVKIWNVNEVEGFRKGILKFKRGKINGKGCLLHSKINAKVANEE